MTLLWIIVAIVVVGLVIWYLVGKKKGPEVPPTPPLPPPPPPETPGM